MSTVMHCPTCGEPYALCTCVRPSGRVRVALSRLLDDPSVSPTDPVRVGIHLLHLGPSDDAAHEAWLDAAEARVLSRGGIR